MVAEVGIAVFAGQASWCALRAWHSFQLQFFRVSFSFQDTDWFCGQHLPHESDRTVSAGPAKVRGLVLFLSLGPCWTCPFDGVLWSCCCLVPSGVVWVVGLCKGRILLVDPCLAKVQQGVYTDFAIGVCLIVLLPAQLLPHQFSLFHPPFVICVGLCVFLYLCVQP